MNLVMRPPGLPARSDAAVSCGKNGLDFGGVVLARIERDAAGATRCDVRPIGEFGEILRAVYGPQIEAAVRRRHRRLRRAAAWLEAEDQGRAGVEIMMMALPELSSGAMSKLSQIAELEKAANEAWRTEPRVPVGQTEGGQWTAGGGGAAALPEGAGPASAERTPRRRPPPKQSPRRATEIKAPAPSGATATGAPVRNLVSVGPAAIAVSPGAAMGGLVQSPPIGELVNPETLAGLGRIGLVAAAATLLDATDAAATRGQINRAIARFGLDPSRPADVMAAAAYVWSRYHLPVEIWDVPFSGAKLDAASEAVMRFALVNPGIFAARLQGPASKSATSDYLIRAVVDGALADYAVASRARPPGVAPELQTKSRSARKAIADELQSGGMQVHHIVPAETWGTYQDIAKLALKAGWRPDMPTNLIALPANNAEFIREQGTLPMHNGSHPIYSADTMADVAWLRSGFPANMSPLYARALLESTALKYRFRIIVHYYYPIIKMS